MPATPAAVMSPVTEITEAAWHLAFQSQTVLDRHNDPAGETFATPTGTFVRVNERHFRIEVGQVLGHAQCCRFVARSDAWSRGADFRRRHLNDRAWNPVAPVEALAGHTSGMDDPDR